jgi:hypothetical protein
MCEGEVMQTYTAFCLHTDGRGTTWIAAVDASSIEEAQETAKAACADDWDASAMKCTFSA